jgi:hypothetical protein
LDLGSVFCVKKCSPAAALLYKLCTSFAVIPFPSGAVLLLLLLLLQFEGL